MDLYAETVLDHYRHPRNKIPPKEPTVGHEEKNLSCGDALKVELCIEGDRIVTAGWTGDGCAVSQAAMSMLSETLAGKSISDIEALSKDDILSLLQIPVGTRRLKCALLCLHTLKNAIHNFRKESVQSWSQTMEQP